MWHINSMQDFNNLTSATQNKLLSIVQQVIERGARTRFYPDDDKIKNVTPEKEKTITVFELRVFEPPKVSRLFHQRCLELRGSPLEEESTFSQHHECVVFVWI